MRTPSPAMPRPAPLPNPTPSLPATINYNPQPRRLERLLRDVPVVQANVHARMLGRRHRQRLHRVALPAPAAPTRARRYRHSQLAARGASPPSEAEAKGGGQPWRLGACWGGEAGPRLLAVAAPACRSAGQAARAGGDELRAAVHVVSCKWPCTVHHTRKLHANFGSLGNAERRACIFSSCHCGGLAATNGLVICIHALMDGDLSPA